jgi:hypothetical protein
MDLSKKETRILSSVFANLSKKKVDWHNYLDVYKPTYW